MNTRAQSRAPWGVPLAIVAALLACRAGEGDRCVCGDDCREGLVCLASGRVLAAGDCSPAVGAETTPGLCVPADEADDGNEGGGPPEVFMDLGSKRDFDPGPPPDPERETGTGNAPDTSTGTDATTGSSGTTDATGTGSSGGSSSGGSTGSSGGSTSVGT